MVVRMNNFRKAYVACYPPPGPPHAVFTIYKQIVESGDYYPKAVTM